MPMRLLRNANVTGAILAVIITLLVVGRPLEEALTPTISPVTVSDVHWDGDKVVWVMSYCKNWARRLDSVGFVLRERNQDTAVPIHVFNESAGASVGTRPLKPGCYHNTYSTVIPVSFRNSTNLTIMGVIWYQSFHPFWLLRHEFGHVVVPPRS